MANQKLVIQKVLRRVKPYSGMLIFSLLGAAGICLGRYLQYFRTGAHPFHSIKRLGAKEFLSGSLDAHQLRY